MQSRTLPPPSPRRSAALGLRDVLPILPGILPWGMVAGVAAVAAGFTGPQSVGLSLLVFAGASQLVFVDLAAQGAALPVILLATLVVNLRYLMYSAALAPRLPGVRGAPRALTAYLLTDQAFALSVARWDREPSFPHRLAYYLAVSAALWVTWQSGVVAGTFLGARLPAGLELEFSVPLVFIGLLVPSVRDRATGAAAAVAGAVALFGGLVPWKLGLVCACALGILLGRLVESHRSAGART